MGNKKRVLCGYGVDVDAVANHINTSDGSRPNISAVSRGVFGAKIGTKRLLKLFDQKNIHCSWFMPVHTVGTFPEEMAEVRDAGHEIGLHAYTHEYPGNLTTQQFRDVMIKSTQIVTQFCGKGLKGFTALAWDPHPCQVSILEELELTYDHSMMHQDFHCYYAPNDGDRHITTDYSKDAKHWMVPSTHREASNIVEVPASWTFDDWPAFQFDPRIPNSQEYIDPRVLLHIWQESCLYCYENFDNFVVPVTCHPQVSGKPRVLRFHEKFIGWVNQFEGVEWCTFAEMS